MAAEQGARNLVHAIVNKMSFDVSAANAADEYRFSDTPIPYEPRDCDTAQFKYGRDDPGGAGQLHLLKSYGLTNTTRLLEIGPGGGRLAVQAIPYLAPGNYACMEPSRQGINSIWGLLTPEDHARKPTLLWGGNFSGDHLPWKADLVWGHSVLTHLSWNEIGRCFSQLRRCIAPSGALIATYFRARGNPWEPQPYGKAGAKFTHAHKDPFHYRFEVVETLATETGWTCEHAEWPEHNKGQSILLLKPR